MFSVFISLNLYCSSVTRIFVNSVFIFTAIANVIAPEHASHSSVTIYFIIFLIIFFFKYYCNSWKFLKFLPFCRLHYIICFLMAENILSSSLNFLFLYVVTHLLKRKKMHLCTKCEAIFCCLFFNLNYIRLTLNWFIGQK